MIKIGDVLDNRYEIKEKIGQGGMSYVFRAQDEKLGRVVAIKVLKEEFSSDEDFLKKFKNEAMAAAKLSHPNIVAAYDAVDEGDLHYIIMELVEGITLKNYIARKGMLSNRETIGIAMQAAEGISEAHKKGIIHRDIKPQNMIISKDGKVKVADFGIAKAVSGETMNAAVVGSVHYISPEQARTGFADKRSDLYSLGIAMYEMITGRVPYAGDNTVNVVMSHISETMVPPSVYNKEIYPALNDIILKLTKKQPEERYQDASELIADLKRCAKEPEGHFVKLYETEKRDRSSEVMTVKKRTERAEEAFSGAEKTAETEDNKGIKDSKGSAFEEGAAKDEAGKEVREETGRERRLAILAGVGLLILLMLLITWMTRPKKPMENIGTAESLSSEAEQSTEETEGKIDYSITIQGEDLMPDLRGMTVDAARAKLANLQVSMDSSKTEYSDVYYDGLIIGQDPLPDEAIIPGITVHVTVSLGTKINHTLKNLRGKTVEEAAKLLSEAGVLVDTETENVFSETVEKGRVVDWELQAEVPGETAVKEGSTVRLLVSAGKEADHVKMPLLVGMTKEAAELLLNQSGLVLGNVGTKEDASTAPGTVTDQSIAVNEAVKRGTTVNIIVSAELPRATIAVGGTDAEGMDVRDADDYYYGSVDTTATVGKVNGPDAASRQIMVGVRLRQRNIDGSYDYTVLEEPKPVSAGSKIPVTIRNIRGAYGVEKGEVQVYNAETNEVYSTHVIHFAPKE